MSHDDWSENWEYEGGHFSGFGAAHSVSYDPQEDPLAVLHSVVEEVTGKKVLKESPRRIGFF